jgi:hypothetical protein
MECSTITKEEEQSSKTNLTTNQVEEINKKYIYLLPIITLIITLLNIDIKPRQLHHFLKNKRNRKQRKICNLPPIKDNEIKEPKEFAKNFGSIGINTPSKSLSNPNRLAKKKKRKEVPIADRKDLSDFEFPKWIEDETEFAKNRDFENKKLEKEYLGKWIVNYLKEYIIKKVDINNLKKKHAFLKTKLVKNADKSSRFIAFNKKINKRLKMPNITHSKGKYIKDILEDKRALWFIKIDLSKGFTNIPIPQHLRRFFLFKHEGNIYQFRRLIMGSSDSPLLFQTTIYYYIIKPTLKKFPQLQLYNYLDDIFAYSDDKELLTKVSIHIQSLMMRYNLSINNEKSYLIPTRECTILGITINKRENVVRITDETWNNIENVKKEIDNKNPNTRKIYGIAKEYAVFSSMNMSHEYRPIMMITQSKLRKVMPQEVALKHMKRCLEWIEPKITIDQYLRNLSLIKTTYWQLKESKVDGKDQKDSKLVSNIIVTESSKIFAHNKKLSYICECNRQVKGDAINHFLAILTNNLRFEKKHPFYEDNPKNNLLN